MSMQAQTRLGAVLVKRRWTWMRGITRIRVQAATVSALMVTPGVLARGSQQARPLIRRTPNYPRQHSNLAGYSQSLHSLHRPAGMTKFQTTGSRQPTLLRDKVQCLRQIAPSSTDHRLVLTREGPEALLTCPHLYSTSHPKLSGRYIRRLLRTGALQAQKLDWTRALQPRNGLIYSSATPLSMIGLRRSSNTAPTRSKYLTMSSAICPQHLAG